MRVLTWLASALLVAVLCLDHCAWRALPEVTSAIWASADADELLAAFLAAG